MDDADRASVEIEREQERLLASALARAARVSRAETHCLHCGDALPGFRQERGYELCVPCQRQRERLDEIAGVRR